ncbi:MAG: polymer-forming cytoskeletal protein, partial [Sphingomonadales bacterium]
ENGGKVEGKLSHRRHGAASAKAPPPLEVVENKSASAGF